ncbi:MAG TPA: hypothetical protein VH988_30490 [Thermoanaerobaculia bacterium]|jgi:hypothetical protein|nr:hypothetical protein [Thermoanaerobaculia bacterium]
MLLIPSLLLILLAAVPAGASVGGTVYYESYAGGPWQLDPSNTMVKFCNVAYNGAWSGQGQCYTTTTDAYNNFSISLPNGSYATFVWNNAYTFGSDSSAAWGNVEDFTGNWTSGNQLNINVYTYWVVLYQVEWPNQPQVVYPANGARQVPLNFNLKWTPDHTGWQVVYDIYGAGDGAPEILELSNLSCNPDASGNCSYPVSNLVAVTPYTWHVVAKLHPGWSVDPPSNIYVTNSSADFRFATSGTTYSLTTVNGYKVSADGCGGSTVSARGTTVGNCETLRIFDLNGGTLQSGDSINIEVYATNWRFSAVNGGGGALLANTQWGAGWETFIIAKTTGTGTISNGDTVSLRAYNGNYCSAELGGGDVVNCNRASVGPWETFTFGVMP